MTTYWCVFAWAFMMYHIVFANKSRITRTLYNSMMGIILFLLLAFRDISMGMYDVANSYVPSFLYEYNMPWSELFERFKSDHFFYVVSKLIRDFTDNPHIWITAMSVPISIAVTMLINRYSEMAWLSWIMFYSLGFFSWNITVMRQSVAMAMGVFSVMALFDGKRKTAFLLWAIAVGFHISAVVAVVPLILDRIKLNLNLKRASVFMLCTLLIWIASRPIIEFLFRVISMYRFQRYILHLSSFNATLLLIYLAIALFCVVIKCLYARDEIGYTRENALLWLYMCSLPFFAATSTFADLYRLALYFCIYSLICVPNSLVRIKNPVIRFISMTGILIVLLCYAFIRGLISVIPYTTFF